MRIPDYRNVHGVKGMNQWVTKIDRVDKAHKDEFEKELEDSIHKRKSETKTKKRRNSKGRASSYLWKPRTK